MRHESVKALVSGVKWPRLGVISSWSQLIEICRPSNSVAIFSNYFRCFSSSIDRFSRLPVKIQNLKKIKWKKIYESQQHWTGRQEHLQQQRHKQTPALNHSLAVNLPAFKTQQKMHFFTFFFLRDSSGADVSKTLCVTNLKIVTENGRPCSHCYKPDSCLIGLGEASHVVGWARDFRFRV